MAQPVIVEAVRTPIGKRNGWMSGFHPAELLGNAQVELVKRAGVDPARHRPDRGRLRDPGGRAGLQRDPHGVAEPGPALRGVGHHHRLPVRLAAAGQPLRGQPDQLPGAIECGIGCGVEAMSRVGLGANVFNGPGRSRPESFPWDMPDQFGAAERIAQKYGISRDDVDWLGFESQRKAARAVAEGRFDREIVPLEAPVVGPDGSDRRAHAGHQGPGPPGDDARGPGRAQAGPARRHPHRRQQLPDLGRRRRRAVDVRGAGQGDGIAAPGPHRGPDARRLRSLLPPRRPHRRHHRRAQEGGHDHRRHRPLRGQRGLRLGRRLLGTRSTKSTGTRST